MSVPLPTAIPEIVPDPMSSILDRLTNALQQKAPTILASLAPGLTDDRISTLETQSQIELPDDIRDIYRWHNGQNSGTYSVDSFPPGHCFPPLEWVFGEKAAFAEQIAAANIFQRAAFALIGLHRGGWLQLFDDGFADGYFYDPSRLPSEGPVFFNIVPDETETYILFPSIKNLFTYFCDCYESGAYTSSPSGESHEDCDLSRQIVRRYGEIVEL